MLLRYQSSWPGGPVAGSGGSEWISGEVVRLITKLSIWDLGRWKYLCSGSRKLGELGGMTCRRNGVFDICEANSIAPEQGRYEEHKT
jgi:hypothetical protein